MSMSVEQEKGIKKNPSVGMKSSDSFDITIQKQESLPIFSQVQSLLEKRSHLQILSKIMIDATGSSIHVYASDSEMSFSGTFKGSVKKPGRVVVDGKKVFEIIKEMEEGDIRLVAEQNHQLKIVKDKSTFKIHGTNPNDFPAFPKISEKAETHNIPVEDILDVIDKTLYCVSLDESRYHLTGVFCEPNKSGYRFVATDGHRMTFTDVPVKGQTLFKDSFIIPKKAFQEIKKMTALSNNSDTLEITLDKPRLIVRFKDQTLIIRLIEGNYPNYKLLIPKTQEKEITLDKDTFFNALKRISILTNIRYKGVTFSFKDNQLTISISHPELGEAKEVIDCDYDKEEVNIRFNAKYILDVLQSVNEKQVKIILKDQSSSGLFQGAGNTNYNAIIMPIKF